MATTTYQARLEAVQAAIAKILEGGQEVVYEGRRITYADLATLQASERQLIVMAEREAGGGGSRIRYGVPV